MQTHKIENDLKQINRIYINALNAYAVHYKHTSGMTLFHIEANDPHKTFSFSFRTPPKDDTGVCHIIEHSVCVASKKYPLRDTFMALDQGSINTSLNACTYKDMTTYYGSSLHEEDLLNMIDVYVDLLFHPLMLEYQAIFRQEGWALESEDVDGEEEMSFTGIVYNEMAGEYTEASAFLEYEMHKALFPDTYYQYDSGGVPEHITSLTNDMLLAYYKTHYTPNNMTLVLYGDMDLDKVLIKLEPLMAQKENESSDAVATVQTQEAFNTPKVISKVYPAEEEDAASFLAMGFVLEEVLESETKLAFMMLEHMLLKSAASPLAKVLIEQEKLGISIGDSGYDTGKKQPTFSIVLQGAKSNDVGAFEKLVMGCLRKLADEGLSEELREAAFYQVAFGQHEASWDGEPSGLVYSEWIQMAYMYGIDPFTYLNYEEGLDRIKSQKAKGYFEALIKKNFLDNNHRVTLVLAPSASAYEVSHIRSDKKMDEIIESGYQENSKNDWWDEDALSSLPQFDKAKLKIEKEYMSYQCEKDGETRFIIGEADTKDIAYIQFLFDAKCVTQEEIPYVGLLAHFLSYIPTRKYTYEQLENRINQETGALNCTLNTYSKAISSNAYQPYFKLVYKVLADKEDGWDTTIQSMLTETRFDEKERMKDLTSIIRHDYEKNFAMAPEYRAVKRVYSYFSPIGVYEDLTSGFSFYQFIKELDNNWDANWENLQDKLTRVYKKLIRQTNLTIGLTTNKVHQEKMLNKLKALKNLLPEEKLESVAYAFQMYCPNEAFTMTSQVQAIAKGYDFTQTGRTFHGSMYVVAHLLNTEYLWDTVRLEGGAYGADVSFTRDGSVVLVSYCDPHLGETLSLYDEIGDYLENITLTKEEIDRLIIGTVGQMDYPLSKEEKSEQAITRFLCDLSDEKLQEERKQVLETDLNAIRQVAAVFKEMAHKGSYCVIGGKEKIETHKKLFNRISTLI